jgi:hypothetical protein
MGHTVKKAVTLHQTYLFDNPQCVDTGRDGSKAIALVDEGTELGVIRESRNGWTHVIFTDPQDPMEGFVKTNAVEITPV